MNQVSIENDTHDHTLSRKETMLPIGIQIDVPFCDGIVNSEVAARDFFFANTVFSKVDFQDRHQCLGRLASLRSTGLSFTSAERTNSRWKGLILPNASIIWTGCWQSTYPGILVIIWWSCKTIWKTLKFVQLQEYKSDFEWQSTWWYLQYWWSHVKKLFSLINNHYDSLHTVEVTFLYSVNKTFLPFFLLIILDIGITPRFNSSIQSPELYIGFLTSAQS